MIDGRNSYDQSINDLIKQYDEVRKTSIGQSDNYTTGCSLDYAHFKDNYRLIAVDLNKQKSLGYWSKSNSTNSVLRNYWGKVKAIHYSCKIKRNSLRILQENSKRFVNI